MEIKVWHIHGYMMLFTLSCCSACLYLLICDALMLSVPFCWFMHESCTTTFRVGFDIRRQVNKVHYFILLGVGVCRLSSLYSIITTIRSYLKVRCFINSIPCKCKAKGDLTGSDLQSRI